MTYEHDKQPRAVLQACAVACKSCAEECAGHESHEHCRICAEVCSRCERTCGELIDNLG
ncbi:four-helix bundle copper-binding protein [Mycobacterium gastri]|uniref:four-helix bundle copper-binding protein n=1 Tax=Mycobacterium gastri TaxID=1777 RepID=UPI00111C5855